MNRLLLCIISLALLWLPVDSSRAADWVPPGFESLSEPQVTEIDVYYGGYLLTSVMARFTMSHIEFLDPATLLGQIDDVADEPGLTRAIGAGLPTNEDLLCHSEFQLDCGTVATDDVAVIFDRARLRTWLFISPSQLLTRSAQETRYLPDSSAGLSLFTDNSLIFSGADQADTRYNLVNMSQVAWRENRLLAVNSVTNDGLLVDTLALEREYRGQEYQLGLFRGAADSNGFFSSEQLLGFSTQTSLLTRTDLAQYQGSEIDVFLDSRSRVDIYRDGRLLTTRYYDVGNQIIDTGLLPPGSYDIEIQITDAAGNVRSETRFFAKTSRLPPLDQDVYFLQVGQLIDSPGGSTRRLEEQPVLRAGYSHRLTESLGGNLGISAMPTSTLLEAGFYQQGRGYEISSGLAWESNGATAANMDLRLRGEWLNVGINARRTWSGSGPGQLDEGQWQYGLTMDLRTRYGYFNLYSRSNGRDRSDSRSNYGMRWRSRSSDAMGGSLTSGMELAMNDGRLRAYFTVDYRFNGPRSTFTLSPRLGQEDDADGNRRQDLRGTVESRWLLGERMDNDLSLLLDRDEQSSVEARLRLQGRPGSIELNGRQNLSGNGREYYGRLGSSFAVTGGSGGLGGDQRGESAFLITVVGAPEGSRFDILVNGAPQGEVRAGKTQLLSLPPYETYAVELRPQGDSLINMDHRQMVETLYPGNVVDLEFTARVITIAYGRLLDPRGEPVANALLTNVLGFATTDANGYFQAEIDQQTAQLTALRGQQSCTATFANSDTVADVLSLGSLECVE